MLGQIGGKHPLDRTAEDWYALAALTLRQSGTGMFRPNPDDVREAQTYATLALVAEKIGAPITEFPAP